MRHATTVTPTTTAQSVADLLSALNYETNSQDVILQAPAANGNNINFGTNASQPGFIEPGGSAALEVTSLNNLYVKGDGVDTIIILVLR